MPRKGQAADDDDDEGGSRQVRRRAWTEDEDDLLLRAVVRVTHRVPGQWTAEETPSPSQWGEIVSLVPQRNKKQCRERWQNKVNPGISHASWATAEVIKIFKAHASLGNKWQRIAEHVPGRTALQCRNCFNAQMNAITTKRGGALPAAGDDALLAAIERLAASGELSLSLGGPGGGGGGGGSSHGAAADDDEDAHRGGPAPRKRPAQLKSGRGKRPRTASTEDDDEVDEAAGAADASARAVERPTRTSGRRRVRPRMDNDFVQFEEEEEDVEQEVMVEDECTALIEAARVAHAEATDPAAFSHPSTFTAPTVTAVSSTAAIAPARKRRMAAPSAASAVSVNASVNSEEELSRAASEITGMGRQRPRTAGDLLLSAPRASPLMGGEDEEDAHVAVVLQRARAAAAASAARHAAAAAAASEYEVTDATPVRPRPRAGRGGARAAAKRRRTSSGDADYDPDGSDEDAYASGSPVTHSGTPTATDSSLHTRGEASSSARALARSRGAPVDATDADTALAVAAMLETATRWQRKSTGSAGSAAVGGHAATAGVASAGGSVADMTWNLSPGSTGTAGLGGSGSRTSTARRSGGGHASAPASARPGGRAGDTAERSNSAGSISRASPVSSSRPQPPQLAMGGLPSTTGPGTNTSSARGREGMGGNDTFDVARATPSASPGVSPPNTPYGLNAVHTLAMLAANARTTRADSFASGGGATPSAAYASLAMGASPPALTSARAPVAAAAAASSVVADTSPRTAVPQQPTPRVDAAPPARVHVDARVFGAVEEAEDGSSVYSPKITAVSSDSVVDTASGARSAHAPAAAHNGGSAPAAATISVLAPRAHGLEVSQLDVYTQSQQRTPVGAPMGAPPPMSLLTHATAAGSTGVLLHAAGVSLQRFPSDDVSAFMPPFGRPSSAALPSQAAPSAPLPPAVAAYAVSHTRPYAPAAVLNTRPPPAFAAGQSDAPATSGLLFSADMDAPLHMQHLQHPTEQEGWTAGPAGLLGGLSPAMSARTTTKSTVLAPEDCNSEGLSAMS